MAPNVLRGPVLSAGDSRSRRSATLLWTGLHEPLTPAGFIEAVAQIGRCEPEEARRDIDVVLPTIAGLSDDALLRRILTQLPPGHSGIFGRTDAA